MECLDKTNNPEAAIELGNFMSCLSESYWAAGWLLSLEFRLWDASFGGGEGNNGYFQLDLKEIGKLIELSYKCQGWVVWSKGGNKFMTYEEFFEFYKAKNSNM
jgi:hypothetical protein